MSPRTERQKRFRDVPSTFRRSFYSALPALPISPSTTIPRLNLEPGFGSTAPQKRNIGRRFIASLHPLNTENEEETTRSQTNEAGATLAGSLRETAERRIFLASPHACTESCDGRFAAPHPSATRSPDSLLSLHRVLSSQGG